MNRVWREILWRQFGAAIDMFGNSLEACPDRLWEAQLWIDPRWPAGFPTFWYVAYHTLFWLDLYLSGTEDGFTPPPPFTLGELDPQGVLPERVYTLDELQSYLAHCRQKCRATIEGLTDQRGRMMCYFPWSKRGISFAELLVDNMRHVQEHGAQLNMFIGQQAGISSRWVAQSAGS